MFSDMRSEVRNLLLVASELGGQVSQYVKVLRVEKERLLPLDEAQEVLDVLMAERDQAQAAEANLFKAIQKRDIELAKYKELARRSGMLAEETAKAKAKAEQWGPTVHVNKEELEQVVSGLQAAMQRNPPPAPFPQEFFLKHGKEVSPQEIVEELEGHIKELQDKLANDTDAAAYQKLVDKLALTSNRLNRSINTCGELETQALTDANTILELRKQVESDKKERNRLREILGLEDFAPDAEGIPAHVRGLKGKIKDLEDKLAHSNAQEVRLNVEVQHLKKALAQATGVPILSATQQVKVE